MAYHGPVGSYAPLGEEENRGTLYGSPASYAQPFSPQATHESYGHHGDLGLSDIEMYERRPQMPGRDATRYSSATIFPPHGSQSDAYQSFLHDPVSQVDTWHLANTFVPYKDNTGRQLWHILRASLSRWMITVALCMAMIVATRIWQNKGAQSETQKKVYNAIATGIQIAMGLNLASAFKEVALNMRWPILAGRARNLVELDLILNADSLTKLTKLVFVSKRFFVIITCIFWLIVNLLAQTGIAMLSLTYGFNTDNNAVLYQQGKVAIPNLSTFYLAGSTPANNSITELSEQYEEYTAHIYGELSYTYGIGSLVDMPTGGELWNKNPDMIFGDDSGKMQLVFVDSPMGSSNPSDFSVYTERRLNVSFECVSYKVLDGTGDGTTDSLVIQTLGNVSIPETVETSTTYITQQYSSCDERADYEWGRCQTVQAFESSDTDPWYYVCNITLGQTINDPKNVSFVSDHMAAIATASIAQLGYTDSYGNSSTIYPTDSVWGAPLGGNTTKMARRIGTYTLGSMAGATIYNPYISYDGMAPIAGQSLQLGHPYYFYLILGLIMGCHLGFIIIVAVVTNRVMVGPDGHISMSMLLRPIADALYGVSGGDENKAFKDAKKNTNVRYEKVLNRWTLNMVDR